MPTTIKFEVKYFTDSDGCNATVNLYLPTEQKDGKVLIAKPFISEVEVFNEQLIPEWGGVPGISDNFRYRSTYVVGSNWEEVEGRVQTLIDSICHKLSKLSERFNFTPDPFERECSI